MWHADLAHIAIAPNRYKANVLLAIR